MIGGICNLILVLVTVIPAQKSADLAAADDLIARRKYASAFRLLSERDPRNEDPDCLEKKIRLALDHSADTIMHRSFTFVDLADGQELDDYKITPELFNPYRIYDFQIDRILESLMRKKPYCAKLYCFLGDYYFTVYRIYEEKWFMPGDELLRRAAGAFAQADRRKALSRTGLDEYALVLVMQKKYNDAIVLYERAMKDPSSKAGAYYGAAYALHMAGDHRRAFDYAVKAIDSFSDTFSKSDAAILAAMSAEALDMPVEALSLYRKSREYGRIDLLNAKKILYYSLKYDEESRWFKEAGALLDLDPHNLEYYYEVLDCFMTQGRGISMPGFLDLYEKSHAKDSRTLGNILLLKSVYYKKVVNDRAKRKSALKGAYAEFKKVFHENDEFMIMIKKELEEDK